MTLSVRPIHRLAVSSLALAAAVASFPTPAAAQYFGRNKVQYERFDFQELRTEHFNVYYYPEERDAALMAGRMAERWYSRLSLLFNHELSGRQPIIMYANHPHFEQTNALAGELGESTGGVTEVFKRRVVLPFAGGLAETDHVLGHELVHAFQFDITGAGRSVQTGGIPGSLLLPLWFTEGMAEYLSVGPVDVNTSMWMRDAARTKLPSVQAMNDSYTWFPYRYGQALWAYLAGRFGDEVVGRLLRSSARDMEGALQRLLGSSAKQLTQAWHQAIHDQADPLIGTTSAIGEYGTPVFPNEGRDVQSVAPAVSPDGRYLAFISARDLYSIDVFIAELETGRVIRKVTHTAVDPHFESLQFISSAGAWSPDGRQFAVAGISRGRPILSLIDVESGNITRDIRLNELGEIYNPDWSPDGRSIVFSAIRGGFSDLFLYDLEAGALRRLTNDPYADVQPAWSPDGSRIAFATERFTTDLEHFAHGDYRLGLLDPATGAVEQVAGFESGKHINPQWTADGQRLLFLSDRSGITNLYRVDLATGTLSQVTNLYTGISGITPLSPALALAARADRAVISVYEEGTYRLYRVDDATVLAGDDLVPAFAGADPARLPPAERITDDLEVLLADARTGLADTLEFATRPYGAGLSLDYVAQPSLTLGSDQFGTFVGGGAALYWSDMLGNRNLTTALQVNGSLKDIMALAGYTNLSRRWNWALFAQQVPILTGYYSGHTDVYNGELVVVSETLKYRQTQRQLTALLAYPFNRVHRMEFSVSGADVRFEQELQSQGFNAVGDKLFDSTLTVNPFPALQYATGTAALVYDNALLGATSPILGQRYRLEAAPVVGDVNYVSLRADYRRYVVPARPFTLAARLLHFGRYFGDAEDDRLRPMFLGWPGLVRGYDDNSFSLEDCDATTDDPCPLFSRLIGSKLAVANIEFRFPLLGALGVGSGYYGFLPIEFALFGDAGIAWCEQAGSLNCSSTFGTTADDKRAFFLGGDRKPVYSAGGALRINLFGFAIVELDLAYAFQRERWLWHFGFTPGF